MKIKFNQQELDRIMDIVDNKMIESANLIKESAKDNCPVRTGKLKEDIQSEYDPLSKKAEIFNTLNYAPYVNLGTQKQRQNPYLERGLFGADLTSVWNK